MSVQADINQIKESLRFLPMQFDELRGDILRLTESFAEELKAEKKSGKSLERLLLNLQRESPYWKAEVKKESLTRGHSLPGHGFQKYQR